VKSHITLRSTLSNISWTQGIAAVLLMAALTFSLALAWQVNRQPRAAQAPVAQPSTNVTSPGIRSPIVAPPVAAPNPNRPVIGTGSAYDGGSYVTRRPAARNPNTPIIGTGSAYDGQ
jgi:hypothetical protein